ncbi:hypothetical protein ACFP67_00980 [Mammaliicoccus sciuri]|uniref:hypothetical protein n=1 Tax=Mammaliicoccus sciuri TaxID=1296 RepID=UPI000CD2FF6B|nr:hypothetical protein [Mammaliicoccus sciuri]PNZ24205.1 hypothetical protein CD114_13585 [Mammaliicoccus sciuri]
MKLVDGIILQDKEASAVIYDDSRELFFEVDYIGKLILSYLLGDDSMKNQILREFEVNINELNTEIEKFKCKLKEAGIIEDIV